MFLVIVLAARFIVGRFDLPATVPARLGAGLVGLGLLVAAEILLVVLLQGRPLGQYIAGRDPVSGVVYLAMLGLFCLMPLIVARGRTSRPPWGHGRV